MKKQYTLIAFTVFIVTIVILNYNLGLSEYLQSEETLALLQHLVDSNMLAAVVLYCLFTVVIGAILALPGFVFAVLGALMFSPLVATVLCLMATTANAGLTFAISRFCLKESLKNYALKNRHLNTLFGNKDKNYFLLMMITRLVPIFPYNLQNFAYGVTDISFKNYIFYTFIFMIPGTVLYTMGMNVLINKENRMTYFVLTALFALFLLAINTIIKKKRILEEAKI